MTDSRSRTIIPALPGWAVAEPIIGENGEVIDIDDDPIIAWCVITEVVEDDNRIRNPVPITLEHGNEDHGYTIRRPDGMYVWPGVQWFNTKEQLIRELNEERAEEKKR